MNQVQRKPGVVIPEKIIIKDVKITNAQVNSTSEIEGGWEEVEMNISTKSLFSGDVACRVIFTVVMEKKDENDQILIGATFTIEFDFEIENLNDFRTHSSDVDHPVQIDRNLGVALMGIVYSTARGIVLTRTAGTVLDGIILPVIDPSTIL
ncbi:hypothetical protein D3C87_273840 [compost metagenome]